MAVKELLESLEAHETSDGTTIRRVFQMFWSDFENPAIFGIFIGDKLGRTRTKTMRNSELVAVDITQMAINNVYCTVSVLYSTQAKLPKQAERPDQLSSWEEVLDITTEELPTDTFGVLTEGADPDNPESWTWKSWAALWAATTTGEEIENNPPILYLRQGRMIFRTTTYASKFYGARVTDAIGSINSEDFIAPYFGKQLAVPIDEIPPDKNKWFFVGCPITRIRINSWRYDWTFEYKRQSWQQEYGITHNFYPERDFMALLADMDRTDGQTNPGGTA